MKIKIIPFDLDIANKIQAGEIKGKIRTEQGIKVLLYKNDSNAFKCWIHVEHDGIHIAYGNSEILNLLKLYLEVPDNEPQFKPFDKVLVRYPYKPELCVSKDIWLPGIFQYKSVNTNLYFVSGKAYCDCISYEGNEHLIGTTDNPK